MSFIRDTLMIFRRQERLALRQPAWVIIGLTQPILYLVLFGPLLKGLPTASLGSGGNAYRFFVPGLLIQLGLFGSTFVGVASISDWRAGVIERFRVTPVSRLSIMAGRVLRDVVTLVVQSVVLVLVSVTFGLRAPVAAVFIGFGFIVLIAALINTVAVPLLLMSGIFLPLTLGPGWPTRATTSTRSWSRRSRWRWGWPWCSCSWARASSSGRTPKTKPPLPGGPGRGG
jgi:ABC-2 type transport system permease protein